MLLIVSGYLLQLSSLCRFLGHLCVWPWMCGLVQHGAVTCRALSLQDSVEQLLDSLP